MPDFEMNQQQRQWFRMSGESTEQAEHSNGSVLVEFAVVVLLIFSLLTVAFDCARMIQAYLLLSQASFEGVRVASMVPGLFEPRVVTSLPSDDEWRSCKAALASPEADPVLPCGLLIANYRMMKVLKLYEDDISIDSVAYASRFEGGGSVSVTLSMPSGAIFPLLRGLTIQADSRLPYFVTGTTEFSTHQQPTNADRQK